MFQELLIADLVVAALTTTNRLGELYEEMISPESNRQNTANEQRVTINYSE